MNTDETLKSVCAQLTPLGRGAVAVIGASGPNSQQAIEDSFLPISGRNFLQHGQQKIVYGIWKSTGEDLIVVRRGSDRFEVHCHGGTMAATAVVDSFRSQGFTEVSSERFANQFESSWLTSTQLALANAPTTKTARLLLQQTRILPSAIAEIESMINAGNQQQANDSITEMLRWAEFGIHLTKPRSVVFCGQPNVGKSSLVNAIVGFQRAIVHDVPGTTRDVVSQSTAIAGWPVSLRDTAGLRESEDLIESKGIEKAKTEIEFADVVVCVFDGSRSWTAEDQAILDSIQPHLVVGNKIDRVASSPSNMPKASDFLKTSATTGQGVENLIAKIANVMVPDSPSKDQAFPVAPDQISELEAMRTSTENL